MGLFLGLIAFLLLVYNMYNTMNRYIACIPMQNSVLQTFFFTLFMMSLYCANSMLPRGRYYYEPEGGYVGNPWVKFSFQYMYLYLGWIDHYVFSFSQNLVRKIKSTKLNLGYVKNKKTN